mgnify:CR=1 FL=1
MEKKIRNKIIALSGQPVTGKGTNVKAMIKKLEERGYKSENIHLIATGDKFREISKGIIELIRNTENQEVLEKLSEQTWLREMLSNADYRSTLVDTIATLKRNHTDLTNFTIDDANNMPEFKNIRTIIDTIIDKGIAKLGKEINAEERKDEIWIVDSRLAFHNIPEAFSVRLTSTPEVAAQRLFNDKKRGQEDQYKTLEEAKEARENRRMGEVKRYKKRYGVDLEDKNNYDLIIDTSFSSVDDISDVILQGAEYYFEDRAFAKEWTSPKTLLPLQEERVTLGKAKYSFEEMLESIKEHGYFPSEIIEAVEVDGIKYIVEGHHRNFSAAYLGKTLIPYEVMAKDDEKIPGRKLTARQYASGFDKKKRYGHEWMIQEQDPNFRYEQVYPNINEIIEKNEKQTPDTDDQDR